MPQDKSRKNELIAGGFVLAMIVVAMGTLALVGGFGNFFGPSPKRIEFALLPSPGIRGLTVRSPVQFGGFQVGEVHSIRMDKDERGREIVVVEAKVRPDLALTAAGEAKVMTNPLGGGGVLDIRSLGTGPVLSEGGRLPADRVAASDIIIEDALAGLGLKDSGQGTKLMDDFGNTLRRADAALGLLERRLGDKGELAAAMGDVRTFFGPGGDLAVLAGNGRRLTADDGDLSRAAADLRGLTAELNKREFKDNFAKFNSVMARLETLTDRLGTLADNIENNRVAILNKLERAADKGGATFEKLDGFLDRNRESLDSFIKNGSAAMGDLRALAAEIGGIRGRFTTSIDNLDKVLGVARDLVVRDKAVLADTLADLRSGARDFKTAIGEIRRAPWRLLLFNYDEKMLANANVLDAARAFNEGAAGVTESTKRLEALLAAGAGDEAAKAEIVRLFAEVRERTARLREAEGRLFDKLK